MRTPRLGGGPRRRPRRRALIALLLAVAASTTACDVGSATPTPSSSARFVTAASGTSAVVFGTGRSLSAALDQPAQGDTVVHPGVLIAARDGRPAATDDATADVWVVSLENGGYGDVTRIDRDGVVRSVVPSSGPFGDVALIGPGGAALAPDGTLWFASPFGADGIQLLRRASDGTRSVAGHVTGVHHPQGAPVQLLAPSAGGLLLVTGGVLYRDVQTLHARAVALPSPIRAAALDGDDVIALVGATGSTLLRLHDLAVTTKTTIGGLPGRTDPLDLVTITADGAGGAYLGDVTYPVVVHLAAGERTPTLVADSSSGRCDDLTSGPAAGPGGPRLDRPTALLRRGDQLLIGDTECRRVLTVGLAAGSA